MIQTQYTADGGPDEQIQTTDANEAELLSRAGWRVTAETSEV